MDLEIKVAQVEGLQVVTELQKPKEIMDLVDKAIKGAMDLEIREVLEVEGLQTVTDHLVLKEAMASVIKEDKVIINNFYLKYFK